MFLDEYKNNSSLILKTNEIFIKYQILWNLIQLMKNHSLLQIRNKGIKILVPWINPIFFFNIPMVDIFMEDPTKEQKTMQNNIRLYMYYKNK